MVGITELWLPILLSAVFVFVASSIIHMVLRYHWTDWSGVPDEDKVRQTLRGLAPGNYQIPHCTKPGDMNSPELVDKWKEGPVGLFTILPSGPPSMAKQLVLWFVYSLVVGVLTAYVTGRTMGPEAHYLEVFRVAGTVAFLTYAGAQPVQSIWLGLRWSTSVKNVFDGLIYALVTAGAFGWLWP